MTKIYFGWIEDLADKAKLIRLWEEGDPLAYFQELDAIKEKQCLFDKYPEYPQKKMQMEPTDHESEM